MGSRDLGFWGLVNSLQWRSQGGTWVHVPPSRLEISIFLWLLGAPRPPPGLCPWTPLGDFRPPDPLFCSPNKFLATPDLLYQIILVKSLVLFCIHVCFSCPRRCKLIR